MDLLNDGYTVKDNLLKICDNEIPFAYKINDVLEVFGMLIVRIESPREVEFNENVFGISLSEQKIKWQIAKLNYEPDTGCPFVGMKFYNNQLYLHNWCDIYLIVNPLTGEILVRSLKQKS